MNKEHFVLLDKQYVNYFMKNQLFTLDNFSENCKTRPIWRRAYSIEQNVKQLFSTNLRKFEVIWTKIDWNITETATVLFKRRSEKRAKNVAFSIHSMTLFHF